MNKRRRPDIGLCIDASRPILGVCIDIEADKVMMDYHSHPRGQLAYASQGVLKVYTDEGIWVVPPTQAVWIPGNLRHSVNAQTAAELRHLFVDPSYLHQFPDKCSVLDVSFLLQALILRVADFGRDYAIDGPAARLCAVVLDELQALEPSRLYLPWAKDRRVQRVMDGMINDMKSGKYFFESDTQIQHLEKWANEVGASKRTLSRLFLKETGMTFKQWRQQLILQEAVSLLGLGKSVTDCSLMLGYRSPSAFVAMFKKVLGKPPAQYFKEEKFKEESRKEKL